MQKLKFNEENYKFDLYSPRQLKSILFFETEEEEELDSEWATLDETAGEVFEETGSIWPGPEIIAILAAALIAGGFMDKNSVITAVRPAAKSSAWKMAGVRDLMNGRDLRLFR